LRGPVPAQQGIGMAGARDENMNRNISVLSLSGIYEAQTFYKGLDGVNFIDLRDVPGTNCMCDDAAKETLAAAIRGAGGDGSCWRSAGASAPGKDSDGSGDGAPGGLHFIDNGNYHYLSALFLEFVREPFSLVVLDHHPDMQAPMFDILSCGGWILHVIENNPYVRDIHVIGADPALISRVDEKTRERVKFYENAMELPVTEHPVYISVDKDVIRRDELVTNWDQGELSVSEVLGVVKDLFQREESEGGKGIIGIDICGECAPEQQDCDLDAAIATNQRFNEEVMQYFVQTQTL